jgi:hypothetical protein
MKKTMLVLLLGIFTLTSCSHYVNGGGGGCGHWYPRKFEKTKVFPTRDHPMYRHGKGW